MIKIKHEGEWIDIGGSSHVVVLDGTRDILTDEEVAILEYDDSVIVHSNRAFHKLINGDSSDPFKMEFQMIQGLNSYGEGHIIKITVGLDNEIILTDDVFYPPETEGEEGQVWTSKGEHSGEWRDAGHIVVLDGSREVLTDEEIKILEYDDSVIVALNHVFHKLRNGDSSDPFKMEFLAIDGFDSYGLGQIAKLVVGLDNDVTLTGDDFYPPTTEGEEGQVWTSRGAFGGEWRDASPGVKRKTATIGASATSVSVTCTTNTLVSYTAWLNNKEILLDHSKTTSGTNDTHTFSVASAIGSAVTIEYWVVG